jgi:integrase
MGLGPTRDIKLSEARDKAIDANRLLAQGTNPKQARDDERRIAGSVLFGPFAEALRLEKEKGFKHKAHKAKWERTVKVHSLPLHKMRVDQITTADVLEVLKPIWLKTQVAARDVRRHLEAFFDAAKALGHRKGDNPAAWKGNLKTLLAPQPKKGTVRGPHKSLDFEDMPEFMRELAAVDTVGARMLETCILTAARTNEINNMCWSDIAMAKAIWTVPARVITCPSQKARTLGFSRGTVSVI